MNTGRDEDIPGAARECFERSVDALPPATANRLRLARRAALANASARRPLVAWTLPLGAAAALVLGLAWWRQAPAPALPATAQATARALPDAGGPAADDDDAALYAWLADTPVASDGGAR
jgi:hypothetical protein